MKSMFKITFVLLLISFSVGAQTTMASAEFKNQAEQEVFWTKQLFEKHYIKAKYKRFDSKIVVNGNSYEFKDKTLEVTNTTQELRAIFSNGILFPSLFEIEFILSGTKQIGISGLEEVSFLSNNPKYKRFKFSSHRKGFLNPTIYFFELTNKSATKNTDILTFINGSTLTFFKDGWTQI
jgi:hypothetical protein